MCFFAHFNLTIMCGLFFISVSYMDYEREREITNIRSHSDCDNFTDTAHSHQIITTEVYPDNPSDHLAGIKSSQKHKSPLVWGEDILFLDQRQHENRMEEKAGTSRFSGTSEAADQECKTVLQRQLQQCDDGQDPNNKLELTVTNMVSLSELSDMSVMEPDKYISLSGFNFFPKDEETEDLNDICSSLQLGGMVETHPCTVEEIHHSGVTVTPLPEDHAPSGRMSLRRTRNASRRLSAHNGDDNTFCSQSDNASINNRKRNMSEHSILSTGSYDDPDSPYNSGGRRKRRRYEEDPSDDPAFEKSRKNAIIAKRNREKKKQLMEQMESRCDKLSSQNELLDTDNNKLRHRVQTLEEEVFYLKSVLANQSALSNVLSSLKSVDQIRFSSSFEASKYSKKGMHSSTNQSQRGSAAQLKVSGGICLHVDGNQVSMEMCAKCAQVSSSFT